MNYFKLKGALTAKDFLQECIQKEYQLKVKNVEGRELFVVFYKGTWTVQDPKNGDFLQVSDFAGITDDGVHTMGLCDGDAEQEGNPLWRGFCQQRLDFHNSSYNGVSATELWSNGDDVFNRIVPAKAITDLILMILTDNIDSVEVLQRGRNGIIKGGEIVLCGA
ncbi:MAG: hypothetical protein KKG39_02380 [Gammaproteobacteria bacterium]|uniref:Uncharacterized protein n=1 Tax=viral metagenome TaxID=1070528 RepID=A0A6H1ZTU0_9ZZZZ|nr:hypothetical protein [Gammaproteobacteria bacterium]